MGRVTTNTVSLQIATEQTPGVLPGSPSWLLLEPNSIGKFGPALKKMVREPISKNRQPRKPALVDLDSSVEFECDVTIDHLYAFMDGFFMAQFKGGVVFKPTATTATDYTVASGGALATNTLVFAQGFQNAANNGLKVVGASSTGTAIKVTGLVAETVAPTNSAVLKVAGVVGASGDFQIDASGNLISTIYNWTTSGLTVGQWIHVGTDSGAANSFANVANRGLARVKALTATKVTLEKKANTFVADTGTGKQIYVLWGQFVRNVASDHADYLEKSYAFELAYKNLQNPGPGDEYEYPNGNFANSLSFEFPLASKSTMKAGFTGLNTPNPTVTRATNAANGTPPISVLPMDTVGAFTRLRMTGIDETGLTTDFSSVSLTIDNGVSPEKILGTLGGKYMNLGQFTVSVSASVLFTDSLIPKAMRDNRPVTMEICCRNDEGAFLFDLPSMTIEGGDKSFPKDKTVSISMNGVSYQDPTLNSCLSLSLFPYLPMATV